MTKKRKNETKKVIETKAKRRITWNDKVAKSRDQSKWRQRIMEGKIEVPLHPTILRQKRVEGGYSQSGMAEKIGLTTTTFGDVERGKRPVKKEVATKIADVIGVSVFDIFDDFKRNKVVAKKVA